VPYRVLAIELCSRGFDIWQNYVDAKEMLRSLFVLATNAKKESISSQNVGPHARTAVLHIVTHNTSLFMTTLSLDILHPRDLEHRKSVMQLVAFLIRKVSAVLVYNSGAWLNFHNRNHLSSTRICLVWLKLWSNRWTQARHRIAMLCSMQPQRFWGM